MATFPPARRSAMIPEPTTVARSSAVPTNSATARFGSEGGVTDSVISAAAPLPALATILPEVVGERAKGAVIGAVVDERPFAAGRQQAGGREPLQVVAERRRWHVELGLDLPGRRSALLALNDVAQDRKTDRAAERGELSGVAPELCRHGEIVSNKFETMAKPPGSPAPPHPPPRPPQGAPPLPPAPFSPPGVISNPKAPQRLVA